ncbi:hypothetical protein LOAG_04800 [Loa loa]|uniref:Uncharacterized protein n=1 Tax=Loa loa TaxID=7209 RepID=A0A1S0U266_LOALO|nr:hypothetical protein LOAG_04800 [Loa loa]EFO23688.1 hypothetical protein LOAG_04800 [Loa loa]
MNEYNQKGLAMIPETNFVSVRQKTSLTSPPSTNLIQHPHRQHDERRLLKDRNRRFEQYRERKGLLNFDVNYYCENTTRSKYCEKF